LRFFARVQSTSGVEARTHTRPLLLTVLVACREERIGKAAV
jgi:hypothetical protein